MLFLEVRQIVFNAVVWRKMRWKISLAAKNCVLYS